MLLGFKRMLGRRRLLLLVGGAAVYPACGNDGTVVPPGDGGADGSLPFEAGAGAEDATSEGSSENEGGSTGSDDGAGDGPVDARGSESSGGDAASAVDASDGGDGGAPKDTGTDCPEQVDGGCATGSNVLFLPFCSYPQLLTVGTAIQTTASNYADPVCGQNGVIVINTAPGQFVALSSSCTHACCTVEFSNDVLHCPCHGVDFNLQGQVVQGSQDTTTPLQVLQACWDSSGVYVTT